jgi:Rrf2 family protein
MISKTGLHAIRALSALAELPAGSYAGAGAIADKVNAPRNYLGKLLQNLAREGLVVSQKGLNGGFRLARDPKTITLLDVVEPIEHVSRWSECFLGKKVCEDVFGQQGKSRREETPRIARRRHGKDTR